MPKLGYGALVSFLFDDSDLEPTAGVLLFAEEPTREQVLIRWQRDELQADCDRINGRRREENPDLPDAELLSIEQLLGDEGAASVADLARGYFDGQVSGLSVVIFPVNTEDFRPLDVVVPDGIRFASLGD